MSFMKRVLRVGLPIAASLIPGVGPLVGMGAKLAMGIGGAVGAASGLLGGGGSSSGSSSSNNPLGQNMAALTQAIQGQTALSKGLIDQGTPITAAGTGYTKSAGDYFGNVLAGGASADKALAGPISDLKTGSNAQLQSLSKFAPRGNLAGQMAQSGSALGGGIARLRYGAQGDAAKGLLGAGGTLLDSGTRLQTGGMQGTQGSLSTLLGQAGLLNASAMQNKAIGAQNQSGLGQGIGSLLGILLGPGGLLNKSKSKSSSSSIPGLGGKTI